MTHRKPVARTISPLSLVIRGIQISRPAPLVLEEIHGSQATWTSPTVEPSIVPALHLVLDQTLRDFPRLEDRNGGGEGEGEKIATSENAFPLLCRWFLPGPGGKQVEALAFYTLEP